MRIIAGKMKGTKLYTLDGLNTRPTLDRVKEPLFSIINFKLQDSVVLDLFSGSGALGLEAISRGAKKAYLCDNSKDAINIINKNIKKTKFENDVEVIFKSYEKVLEDFKNTLFDIVFLDPPYKSEFVSTALKKILNNNLLNENGIIIIETDDKEKVLKEIAEIDVSIFDERRYGRVTLLFLCTKERM
ncbi:MAG: 16S rRNA (guanine(966)-N(2))-methyltransferase RsmD [Clostridia bacterium]|nr:16S rRNA (guanine(966)-N(2))-methyltransferase RsmD [Clostridia bacterium]